MYNGVGGSTMLWAAVWHRLTPADFQVRTLDGVGKDWPISYDDLVPYYDRAEQELGVSGLDGDPAYPSHAPYPMPPFPIDEGTRRVAMGFNKLGWHWWPGSNAIPTQSYRGRNACVRRGTCMIGCADGAKASTNLTHWPDAIARGAELVTGARVSEITIDEQGRASGAVYLDRGGNAHSIRAQLVLLCANGVGTPRLLQLSRSGRFPNGLANTTDLVGRGLMVHPTGSVVATFDAPLQSWRGPQGHLLYSMEFYNSDRSRGFVRGSKWSLLSTGGPVQTALGIGAGVEHHDRFVDRFGKTFVMAVFGEDLPNDENRVVLDEYLTDSNDLPAPRIIYKVPDNTHRLLAFNAACAEEAFRAAGGKTLVSVPMNPAASGAHLTGTARMGEDRDKSVVNSFGLCHDVPNLYICDGSVFPTCGAVNPTATIAALALRCADHIISTRRHFRVAA
jgi:choline dehydrogenase-like flavoprotein